MDIFKDSFDISFMFCVNVLTYGIIQIIEFIFKGKHFTTWGKRMVLLISSFILYFIYKLNGYEDNIILINSMIAAPVSWSWIFKPIAKKLNLDYKPNNIKTDEKDI